MTTTPDSFSREFLFEQLQKVQARRQKLEAERDAALCAQPFDESLYTFLEIQVRFTQGEEAALRNLLSYGAVVVE